ncbi:hypothetical protein SAEN111111_19845 [Saccharibacillus endophyticus]
MPARLINDPQSLSLLRISFPEISNAFLHETYEGIVIPALATIQFGVQRNDVL